MYISHELYVQTHTVCNSRNFVRIYESRTVYMWVTNCMYIHTQFVTRMTLYVYMSHKLYVFIWVTNYMYIHLQFVTCVYAWPCMVQMCSPTTIIRDACTYTQFVTHVHIHSWSTHIHLQFVTRVYAYIHTGDVYMRWRAVYVYMSHELS